MMKCIFFILTIFSQSQAQSHSQKVDQAYHDLALAKKAAIEELYQIDYELDELNRKTLSAIRGSVQNKIDDLYKKRVEVQKKYLEARKAMMTLAPQTTFGFRHEVDFILDVVDRVNSSGRFKKCCDQVDPFCAVRVENQFLGEDRDQGDAGTCSIFGNVGVLEAAFFREYGEKLDLSEMWVARALVQKHLGASDSFSSLRSCKLGIQTEDQLEFIKAHGICRESTYNYNSKGLARFEEAIDDDAFWDEMNGHFVPNSKAFTALKNRQAHFFLTFGGDQHPKVQKCKEEARELIKKFKDFKVSCISDPKPSEIEELLQMGLPLAAGSFDSQIRRSAIAQRRSAHLYIITGYDRERKRFTIRNSQGKSWFFSNNEIPYREAESIQDPRTNGETHFQNMTKACVILGPKDKKRLCDFDPSKLKGRPLQSICL